MMFVDYNGMIVSTKFETVEISEASHIGKTKQITTYDIYGTSKRTNEQYLLASFEYDKHNKSAIKSIAKCGVALILYTQETLQNSSFWTCRIWKIDTSTILNAFGYHKDVTDEAIEHFIEYLSSKGINNNLPDDLWYARAFSVLEDNHEIYRERR